MRSCSRWLGAAGWLTDNNNNNESNECVTVPEGRVIYSMYYDYSDAPARAASQRECLTANFTGAGTLRIFRIVRIAQTEGERTSGSTT